MQQVAAAECALRGTGPDRFDDRCRTRLRFRDRRRRRHLDNRARGGCRGTVRPAVLLGGRATGAATMATTKQAAVFYREYGARAQQRFGGLHRVLPQLERPLRRPSAHHARAGPDRYLRETAPHGYPPLRRRARNPDPGCHAGQSPNEYARVRETENKDDGRTDDGYRPAGARLHHRTRPDHDRRRRRHEQWAGTKLAPCATPERRSATCPGSRRGGGGVIDSIQKYRDMGIRQCLGTDTFPFDMFNDMRMASVVCKIVEKTAEAASSEDVFHMATVGGADALGRPDSRPAWRRAARPTSSWSAPTRRKPHRFTIRSNSSSWPPPAAMSTM